MSCLPLPALEGTRLYVDKTRQKTPKVVLPEPSLSTTDAGTAKMVCVPGLRGKHDVSGCASVLRSSLVESLTLSCKVALSRS